MPLNGKLPTPLDKKELEEKFKKIKNGDEQAKNEIIEHNIRLVVHITKKFSTSPYETEDLISIGIIGLIKAVNSFSLDKNTTFSSYASKCIGNEILMHLRNNNKRKNDISLNQAFAQDNEGNQLNVEDVVEDSEQDFVLEYEQQEINELTRRIIEKLPKEEKYIIMKYFNFIDDEKITQEQLAIELGISRSYLSRKIKKILKKIQSQLEEVGIVKGVNGGIAVNIKENKKNTDSPKIKVLSKSSKRQ